MQPESWLVPGKMTRFTRIVFWQNMASHHQALVLADLAKSHNFQIVWVVEEPVSKDRSEMGWPEFEDEALKLIVKPTEAQVKELVSTEPSSTLHIFGGLFNLPSSKLGIKHALKLGVPLGLMREAPVPPGFHEVDGASKLKKIPYLHYFAHKYLMLKLRKRFILGLCIGGKSMEWIRQIGYPEHALFPWGYFPPAPLPATSSKRDPGPFRICYLGVVSHTKGTDLLIRALAQIKHLEWNFRCVGKGPDLTTCQNLVQAFGLADRVTFEDFKPYSEAMEIVAKSDLVVAPSRHDGWNAVVSESLMRGTKVVVSDAAGASSLVKGENLGSVFPSEDIEALARHIAAQIEKGPTQANERKKVIEWSKAIHPTAASFYFTQIVKFLNEGGIKPPAPWD